MKIKFYLFVIFISCYLVFADRGLIPFDPGIEIYEPNQRAMIAWNGEEEILLLSTDLSASDSTTVMEILPLPSEPKVKKGDLETFRRIVNLVNQHLYAAKKRNGGQMADVSIPPPAEITFHEKIGAHDISVIHLKEENGFIEWVKGYLMSLGFDKEIISDAQRELVSSYIDDGFTYFVFDVITLDKSNKTLEPIQYCFETKKLFYPLKITKMASGYTTIELVILTPRLLSRFSGISINRIQLKHEPISIDVSDLKNIDVDIYELLKGCNTLKIRIWKIEGELGSFGSDLIAQ
ncbi:MAG: DUF2330 domain-containing protein [bacterium]